MEQRTKGAKVYTNLLPMEQCVIRQTNPTPQNRCNKQGSKGKPQMDFSFQILFYVRGVV
jgi:hypothetical protein